ncbi:DUF485 domain-containing protein [Geobacter argillaceus]|uniref:Uncharacterized membrane protein (DUF485 family) n=1 Tax=Geobacter argillaceus TaxID=345631 RepID=A0A562WQV7_9BACT|nr:DUF485 domain-containing protein [Geobacter argillaceus]TWJ32618.1 uncharacterized membrane protein (DUF485 family) [Geobacter argillaceus]
MIGKTVAWSTIVQSPKFLELHRKKSRFLVGLWLVGAISYFLVLIGALYAPDLFNTKIIGRLNFGYLFCLFQFVLAWAIALYYTYRSNHDFDPLMNEVLDLINKGELE